MTALKHATLAEALVALQAELPVVPKNHTATVPTKTGGSYRYTYADLTDVAEAAKPLLARHGLSFTSHPRHVEGGSYELVGVLRHTSGESDEGSLPLFGRTAQELGGSITYNRRYLLGCMTGLVTDDDNDGAHAASARTAIQEPPPPPPSPLEEARALIWDAWTALHPEGTSLTDLGAYYMAEHGGDSVQAADEAALRAFAEKLRTEGLVAPREPVNA